VKRGQRYGEDEGTTGKDAMEASEREAAQL